MVNFTNKEILDEALADGKGAILAALHSGNWELLGGVLASEGYPLISVALKQNGDADKFINEYRELMHQHVMYKIDGCWTSCTGSYARCTYHLCDHAL